MSDDKGINAQELKELKRVFDHLANYRKRMKIQAQLGPKMKRKARIEAHKRNPDEVKITDKDSGDQMSETQIDSEYSILETEVEGHQADITKCTHPSDGIKKIAKYDLAAALKAMGKTCSRQEIETMVWEVNDSSDGNVDWDEFRLMFHRNITDETGLECTQLYNIVQFMTYDKTFSGSVTVDDTMSMLYARFGRDQLETQMRKLFGSSASSADGGGSLTITDYLKAVSKREIKPKGLVECKRAY